MACDVVVVGGGISGLYMAKSLMRKKKEGDVCLFEKSSRFGGRNYDVSFSRAPNVSLSELHKIAKQLQLCDLRMNNLRDHEGKIYTKLSSLIIG